MFARSAFRSNMTNAVARRGFQTSRAQMSGHYPEGPGSSIPFNPKTKYFFWRYWGFMSLGFGAPFMIAVWQTKKSQ